MYRKIMEGKYEFNTPEWDDQSELSKNLVSFWRVRRQIPLLISTQLLL